jgi:Ca2+-transporting ATPase
MAGCFIPYPFERVVGTIAEATNAQAAIEMLLREGFQESDIDVLGGEEDLHRLDPTGSEHGFLARFLRALIRTLGPAEEFKHLSRHGDDVRAGRFVIMVLAKDGFRFLSQFQDVLVILLLIATAVSAGLWMFERDAALPYEAIAILAVVLLNATMGYVQESKAEAAVAALHAMSAADATVIRSGERRGVRAAEVVPGDVILVEEGDTIPADARLVESAALQTAEAALTGESLPVSKNTAPIDDDVPLGDRDNMVFSGTTATYGHGMAIVTATGMHTEMGRIAGLLKETPDESTPLQRELDRTGKVLGLVVIAIAVIMIVTIILVEDVRGVGALFDVLILGVALAVAAVPEGLPAVVTAVLSIGVQRVARRNAIVRHLAAVETLGSATVIASDKTGTLTKNEMTVRVVVTASGRVTFAGSGYAPEGRVRADGGAPIEGTLRVELERALAVADRANNATVQQRDGRWTAQGDGLDVGHSSPLSVRRLIPPISDGARKIPPEKHVFEA